MARAVRDPFWGLAETDPELHGLIEAVIVAAGMSSASYNDFCDDLLRMTRRKGHALYAIELVARDGCLADELRGYMRTGFSGGSMLMNCLEGMASGGAWGLLDDDDE